MTFSDFRVSYDATADAIRLNDFVVQFEPLFEHLRKIQLRRLKAQAPPIIEEVQDFPPILMEACTS